MPLTKFFYEYVHEALQCDVGGVDNIFPCEGNDRKFESCTSRKGESMKFYLLVDRTDPTRLHYNARGIAIYTDVRRAKKHLKEDANMRWDHETREYVPIYRYELREFDTEKGEVIP